jgi:DNA-binding cell septation regulator SpoVG
VFRDIIHPISQSARSFIESEIIDAYEKHLAMLELEEENPSEF